MGLHTYRHGFSAYLQLERAMSDNTYQAYLHDVDLLIDFMDEHYPDEGPQELTLEHLQEFITYIANQDLGPASQARVISGIKGFIKYLISESIIDNDPSELLRSPKAGTKLPEFLTWEEVEMLLNSIDLSTNNGHRNRAMLEILYGCGLRVSELISIKKSNLYQEEAILLVTGKGNKQRLVPVGEEAMKQVQIYLTRFRVHQAAKKNYADILFLNNRGTGLTRQMVFVIIRDLMNKSGIHKKISPHTFRHSYATHLIQHGAHLRAVQQLLGHSSITTTEIYTHLNKEDLRQAILKYHPRNK